MNQPRDTRPYTSLTTANDKLQRPQMQKKRATVCVAREGVLQCFSTRSGVPSTSCNQRETTKAGKRRGDRLGDDDIAVVAFFGQTESGIEI